MASPVKRAHLGRGQILSAKVLTRCKLDGPNGGKHDFRLRLQPGLRQTSLQVRSSIRLQIDDCGLRDPFRIVGDCSDRAPEVRSFPSPADQKVGLTPKRSQLGGRSASGQPWTVSLAFIRERCRRRAAGQSKRTRSGSIAYGALGLIGQAARSPKPESPHQDAAPPASTQDSLS